MHNSIIVNKNILLLGEKMINDGLSYVIALLKKFGTIIYVGNRLDEIILMEMELDDLFEAKLITRDDFIKAKGILRKEFKLLENS